MSIKFGNKNVGQIFFGNKAVKAVYFGAKLVWQKIQKLLRMGDERWVCIEYEADRTETVSTISVFLDKTTNSGYMWIMEDNHCVALSTDQGDAAIEKYELSGYLRTHRFTNLKFYEGHTYYICWKHWQWDVDNSTPDYFAYYQGQTGNYKKICINGNINTLTSNCGLYEYMGELSTLDWDTIMKYQEGKAFYSSSYNSDAATGRTSSYPTSGTNVALYDGQVDCSNMSENKDRQAALYTKFFTMRENDVMFDKESTDQNSKFYKRSGNYTSNTYLGRVNDFSQLNACVINDIFYWTGGYVQAQFGDDKLYKSKANLTGMIHMFVNDDFSGLTEHQKMAKIYMIIGKNNNCLIAMNTGSYPGHYDQTYYPNYFTETYLYKCVNLSENNITSITPITEEPAHGGGILPWYSLFYKAGNCTWGADDPDHTITEEGIVIWLGHWEKATDLSAVFTAYKDSNNNQLTVNNIVDEISFNNIVTDETGTVKNNATVKISQVTNDTLEFKNTQVDSSHKKHYLEINDREV